MDPGTIIAVVETSFSVLSLIAKYYSDVKKAKEDIEHLNTEVEALYNVLREIQGLVQGSKLPLLSSLATAIQSSLSDIENIKTKLDASERKKARSCIGFRALKWPFTKKEVEEHIARLEKHKTTLALALNSGQTSFILGIDENVSQLQQDHDLAEQDRQLRKLLVADDAAYDSFHQQHEPQCAQNTRVDLLHQVQAWNTSDDKCIFWLNGMAGTGKSTIARTVACAFADQDHLGASFFFSRGSSDLGHATKFVSTLARQLAGLSPSFRKHISQAIADHETVTRQGLRNQWKELILRPLSMLNRPDLVLTLVIDALDECERDEDIKLILQLFIEVKDLDTVKLKIFLTSRPETPIRLGFQDIPEILHHDIILHDIPRSVVEQDINVFLTYELDKIRKDRNLSGDWPDDKSINLLVKRSDCLFIYIATACRFIRDTNWRPQEQLLLILESNATGPELTAELDGMYKQILELSIIRLSGQKERSRLSKRFKHIIGSIVTLLDGLPTIALASLLKVPIDDVSLTLNSLHSVLNVPREPRLPIRLLHPSFRDFLVNNERCDNSCFYINQDVVHMELARSCLELLFHYLKRDMCNLQMPGTPMIHSEVQSSKIDDYLPKDVQYACRYWVDHLERIDPERQVTLGLHDDGQIHVFLLKHVLHWLEALSLMGKTSEGVLMITRLDAMLEPNEHPALKATVYDAKRFIVSYRSIIEEAPLQLYGSALLFCPKKSLIKALYPSEIPTWITRYPVVEENWCSLLQVLEGHTGGVTAVGFSGDGQLLASASWDQMIRLWDPATGTLRSTLEAHTGKITALAFSDDSQHLASASWDRTIRLWHPATGILQNTLECHTDIITAVAFSSDGQLLASASVDQTVRLWTLATGALQSTLEGHTGSITAVAFSGNSQFLASSSGDNTIRLWNPATGTLRSTLEGHTDKVTAVAFSGNSQLLASASEDRNIRLWNPEAGTLRNILEGHTDITTAVAFSGDGQLLASASTDRMIRLWDPATATLQSSLEGHTGIVNAVAFSRKGRLLASASGDQTIRLWDLATETPATGTQQSSLDIHADEVTAVTFSRDGRFLASTSDDLTIWLWDPATGTRQSKLEGHTDKIMAVAFSSDSELLASASFDQTVRLWHPATGTLRNTLEGHTNLVTAVAFSGSTQLLASASDDKTIRVWDPMTGTLRSTLEVHKGWIVAVAFSGDGQLLASASVPDNQKIRLWDLATGTLRMTLEGHTDRITAVAFSADSQLLASASDDRTMRLWDPAAASPVQQFKVGGIQQLSFSPDGMQLETNLGLIQLSNDLDRGQSLQLGPWMVQRHWLTWNNRKVLWLPPDFRASCSAIRGSLIVIGHFSGRVTFLGLQSSFDQ